MSKENLLDRVNSPADLKQLNIKEKKELCGEIRNYLIENISRTGGHLSSNLGTVELTVAIHSAFSSPEDTIIFDVGHQSYTHKILTGRKDRFSSIRQKDGISGFTRPSESEHDGFIAGHASNSISAALGIAEAKRLKGDRSYTVAVIGDGAFTGGEAYEAINNAARSNSKIIIVLNHNEMSISKNVGGLAKYLSNMRTRPGYVVFRKGFNSFFGGIPLLGKPFIRFVEWCKRIIKSAVIGSTFFEEMGLTYLGPLDGHNIKSVMSAFERAKRQETPTIIQVKTVKGKGYDFAEENPGAYHSTSGFDITKSDDNLDKNSYSVVAGNVVNKLADNNPKICAVTAAMKYGTGLKPFSKSHRSRFFDVGIAEEHAVTFAGGLAQSGMLPMICIYSTFLQRAYDQIIHDLSIETQRAVILVDRAGFVSGDGDTHQGIYDAAFLSQIPNITLYSPEGYAETELCIRKATIEDKMISAVRYPKGREELAHSLAPTADYALDKKGGDILLVSYGREFSQCYIAAEKSGRADLLKLTKIFPLSQEALKAAVKYKKIIFAEEGIRRGGIAEHFSAELLKNGFKGEFVIRAIDGYSPSLQGSVEELQHSTGLDSQSLQELIEEDL